MTTTPITQARTVDPRAAALLARWAIRYAAGRATGAFQEALTLSYRVAPHATAAERDALIAEAERAAEIAYRLESERSTWANTGEGRSWTALIDRLRAIDGDGDDELVDVGLGRALALCANSAVRRLTGFDLSSGDGTREDDEAVAAACAATAPQFSPSDRVLMMRDLYERHSAMLADGGLPRPWCELYATLAGMELDQSYLRHSRVPVSLGDA